MTDERHAIGGNNPPAPAELFGTQVEALQDEAERLAALEIDASVAARVRDVIAKATALTGKMETARKADKQPHMDAAKAVDDAYRPLAEQVSEVKGGQNKLLTAFMLAEERRRQEEEAEARRVAEEARRRAEEEAAKAAAEPTDDSEPFDPFAAADAMDAAHEAEVADIAAHHAFRKAQSVSVASSAGLSRAASLRTTWRAEVTDPEAAARYFAKNPDVQAAITKAASALARSSKGTAEIPGCRLVPERTAA